MIFLYVAITEALSELLKVSLVISDFAISVGFLNLMIKAGISDF